MLQPMKHLNHSAGFTMMELIVVLAIVSIVSLIAMPDGSQYRNDTRLRAATNDMVVAMQASRAEAVGRNAATTICVKNADSTNCAGSAGWHEGWIIFVDPDQDANVDGGEEIVQIHDPLQGKLTMYGTSGIDKDITFRASGQTSITSTQTLIACDERGFSSHAKGLIITILGRASVMSGPDTGQTTCLLPGG
jgi:type IV fimbrial biogenesis protein FimT